MPHDQSELNMRLFADKVLPVLKHDALFTRPPEIVTSRPVVTEDTGVFVPA